MHAHRLAALAARSAISFLAILAACQPAADQAATPPATASLAATDRDTGVALSGPFVHDNLSLWLVHGEDAIPSSRKLLPLEEAIAQGIAVVHETGSVNELAIENNSPDVTVWVQAGDVVQGGQQDRTIGVDLALAPQSGRVPIASFCVEAGRWSVRGGGGARQIDVQGPAQSGLVVDSRQVRGIQTVETAELPDAQVEATLEDVTHGFRSASANATTASIAFELSEHNVATLELKKAVLLDADQSRVWENVAIGQSKLVSNVGGAVVDQGFPTSWQLTLGSEAAVAATAAYEDALRGAIEGHDDIVGCVVVINGELDSADVYASSDLFGQLWPKLLRGSAIAALAAKDRPMAEDPADETAVRTFLADADGGSLHTRNVGDRGTMTTGENDYGHVVEARTANDEWVHRTWLRK